MAKQKTAVSGVSRRQFVRGGAMVAIGAGLMRNAWANGVTRGPQRAEYSLNEGWMFGEELDKHLPLAATKLVNLPHCPVALSWQKWEPDSWQKVWIYRRSFSSPLQKKNGDRVFLHFDAVMTRAVMSFNGTKLDEHLGGFLPFDREITSLMKDENVLELGVDGRWLNVPPGGGPKGPRSVDYLMPAGITRGVSLRVVPQCFISDVFAKPRNVLTPQRNMEVMCTLDAKGAKPGGYTLRVSVMDGDEEIARQDAAVHVDGDGKTETKVVVTKLDKATLWSPEEPKLYGVRVALMDKENMLHEYRTRVGFRDAHFAVDGFTLNGKKTRLFGLNRHELFPYVGFSMPSRVMRHDAEMLKHKLHVNMVRCSHYPQTEAFLDACDELGIMVWQETPGWQYLGDDAWRAQVLENVHDMIVRDRNHASIIIWGTRVNESANDVPLYTKTNAIAKSLDDSRPVSGTMTHYSTENWIQDVFAYDDYHQEPDGSVGIRPPLPNVPYMVSEAVGQYSYRAGTKGFGEIYRRAGDREISQAQAINHAEAHDRAARDTRNCGLIAWCAFEYASLDNGYLALKCPGVVDTFRIPKMGASFYHSQVSPEVHPVIEPSFYWDFGPEQKSGPGKKAAIFSNCDRLRVQVGNDAPKELHPDKDGFPNLAYAPFFIDLKVDGSSKPELKIDGYAGDTLVLSRTFSSDRTQDKLAIAADDAAIHGDGCDATRVAFMVVDKYGATCGAMDGDVNVTMIGLGEMIGDTTFAMNETGGVGAVWVRAKARRAMITVMASHPRVGRGSVKVNIEAPAETASI
jgi:beta-galactosidase